MLDVDPTQIEAHGAVSDTRSGHGMKVLLISANTERLNMPTIPLGLGLVAAAVCGLILFGFAINSDPKQLPTAVLAALAASLTLYVMAPVGSSRVAVRGFIASIRASTTRLNPIAALRAEAACGAI